MTLLIILFLFLIQANVVTAQNESSISAQTIKHAHQKDFEISCDSANIHLAQGNFPVALSHAFSALKLAEQMDNNVANMASSHSLIGSIYYRLKEFDRALYHLGQAEDLFLQLSDNHGLGEIYYKKGIVYDELEGQQKQAAMLLRKALAVYKKENSCSDLADIYNALAGHYYMQRQTDSVVHYATQALQKFEECGTPSQQAAMYINIAALKNSQLRHNEAIEYNRKGIGIAAEHTIYSQLRQGYKNLSETYAYMGDYENAYANVLLYNQYKDSVISEEKNRVVLELTTRYETEKREKLLAEKEAEVAKTKMHRRVLLLVLFLVITILFTYYHLYSLRKRQNQKLKLLNNTKDKLFSIISHDLKSPAIAQKMALEEIVKNYDYYDSNTLRNYLQAMQRTSESQMELLQGLLQWAQIQTNKIKYNPRPFYASEVVDEVVNLYLIPARNKGVTINTDIPDDCVIYADKDMIVSVLGNLVSNAIKFSFVGNIVRIIINCQNERTKITVADQGLGMSAEQINEIESSDSHTSRTGTQAEKGSGLGLTICKDLLHRNNSRLTFNSSPGKGCEVSFELESAKE